MNEAAFFHRNNKPGKETVMTPIVWTYVIYIALSIPLTVWVAQTLHKNGRIFLIDSFHGNEQLAGSVNHLLVVGFYLINIGDAALFYNPRRCRCPRRLTCPSRRDEATLRFVRCAMRTLCSLSQLADETSGFCAACVHRIAIG